MIVTALIIGAIATVSAHISALDTASAAARAHAIGVDYQPSGNAQISVQESAGLVTVTAEVPAVFELAALAQYTLWRRDDDAQPR